MGTCSAGKLKCLPFTRFSDMGQSVNSAKARENSKP